MKKNVTIQTRMPKEMKEEAGKILKQLGLDFSKANRIFYAQIIQERGIPFTITLGKQKDFCSNKNFSEKL